ncbi:hypothetical protein B0H16DRAFT_1741858 [Mycena metata]|uniref:Uncharacterized protein n=1 Tax=Mycena metata TaxID=1033252 RepID=A0AAD7HAP4_9AGAR|nr:hypothetical protein B0H16DRAFT_1741858 [Mycena metata]
MPTPTNEYLDIRRGRSADRWIFRLQAHRKPIRPAVRENFVEALWGALTRLRFKEVFDPVFRADILESESCDPTNYDLMPYWSPLSSPQASTRALTPTEPATPEAEAGTPARATTPEATPLDGWSSPVWPKSSPERSDGLPADESQHKPASVYSDHSFYADPSPQKPDSLFSNSSPQKLDSLFSDSSWHTSPSSPITRDCDVRHLARPHDHSPTVTELFVSTPSAPSAPGSDLFEDASRRKKLITYSHRDRERFGVGVAETESAPAVLGGGSSRASPAPVGAAASTSAVAHTAPVRKRPAPYPPALRRSLRLAIDRGNNVGYTAEEVYLYNPEVISFNTSELRPWVDRDVVIGLLAGDPIGDPSGTAIPDWILLRDRGTRDLLRVHLNANFSHLHKKSDRYIRWPHEVANTKHNKELIRSLALSDFFRALAAYQNHLLKQFAPHIHAHMSKQLVILASFAAFRLHTRRNVRDVMHGMHVLGNYRLCVCVIPGNNMVLRCPPGTTVSIASSVKEYFFSKVGNGKTRYFFQQFFNTGIQRWIDHGFRSDTRFEEDSTPEEMEAVEARMANHVPFSSCKSRVHIQILYFKNGRKGVYYYLVTSSDGKVRRLMEDRRRLMADRRQLIAKVSQYVSVMDPTGLFASAPPFPPDLFPFAGLVPSWDSAPTSSWLPDLAQPSGIRDESSIPTPWDDISFPAPSTGSSAGDLFDDGYG